MSNTTKELAYQRKAVLENLAKLKDQLKEIDTQILGNLQEESTQSFGNEKGQKTHGEQTFHSGGCKVTLKRARRVKYDNDGMLKAGQNLTWELLNRFFKIKFEMGEGGYKELQAAALDSEVYSDILSHVDDSREVMISDVTLAKIEIEE